MMQAARRGKSLQILLFVSNRKLASAFLAWRATAQRSAVMKHQATVLLAQFTKKHALVAFLTWKQHCKDSLNLKARSMVATSLRNRGLTAVMLSHWRQSHRQRQLDTALLDAVTSQLQRRKLRASFLAFREATKALQRRSVILRSAVTAIAQRRLKAGWTSWKLHYLTRAYCRHLLSQAINALQGRTTRYHFSRWLAAIKQAQSQADAAADHSAKRRLQHCFGAWRLVHREQGALLAKEQALMADLSGRLLLSGILQWKAYNAQQKHIRALMTKAVATLHSRQLTGFFAAWAGVLDQNARREACAVEFRSKILHHLALHSLRSWAGIASDHVTGMSRIQHSAAVRGMRMAFQEWRNRANMIKASTAKMHRVRAALCCRSLRAAFSCWHARVLDLQHQRQQMRKILSCVTHRAIREAFAVWVASLLQHRRYNHVICALSTCKSRQALTAWKEGLQSAHEARAKAKQILGHMQHRTLCSAYKAWHEAAQKRTSLRLSLGTLSARLTHRLQARPLKPDRN